MKNTNEKVVKLMAVVAIGSIASGLFADEGKSSYGLGDFVGDVISAPFHILGGALESVGESKHISTDAELLAAIKSEKKEMLASTLADYTNSLNRIFYTKENGDQYTPLTYAARWCDVEVIELLVSKGADPNFLDVSDTKPIEMAVWKGDVRAVRKLLELGARIDSAPLTAAKSGNLEVVRFFVEEKNIPVNGLWDYERNEASGFMLAKAASRGRLDVCKYLLGKGADVDFRPKANDGRYFYSAIEMASRNGQLETVVYLKEVSGAKLYDSLRVAKADNVALVKYLKGKQQEVATASNSKKETKQEESEPGVWKQFRDTMANQLGTMVGEEIGKALFQ